MFQENGMAQGKDLKVGDQVFIPGTGRNVEWKHHERRRGVWWWIRMGRRAGVRSQRALIATLGNLAFILREMGSHWEILSNREAWSVLHFRKMPLHRLQLENEIEEGARLKATRPLTDHYSNTGKRKWLSEVGKCLSGWRYVYCSEWYLSSWNLQRWVVG